MQFNFPENFYWGSATSSYQIEGNNHNDWSEWEKKNAGRLAKEAKNKWKNWQKNRFPEMFEEKNYVSGKACDHYNRFREDFDIAKSLGHNAHRFSVEWSRIEPEEGRFDEKEIEHYREVIKALRERELEPFVTLWHWTLPVWVAEQGGWENKKTIDDFLRYAGKIASSMENMGVKFWITLNEPEVYAATSYLKGIWPPQKKNILKYFKVLRNLAEAHKIVYKNLHSDGTNCKIGIAKHNIYFKNMFFADYFWNIFFMKKISKEQDFIGLNYYKSFLLRPRKKTNVSDMDWRIYPQGIYYVLKDLKKYKLPVYITENGIADAKDEKRAQFIKEHLHWVHKAIGEGVDVRGYFYWSLLDNFEWDKGFWPRFGLVEIDYKTLERKIRPSALEYKKIIKENVQNDV